mgnify:CR=1 FL=1
MIVGVPVPVWGMADSVAGIVTRGEGEGKMMRAGVADGVATKAGPSAAETTNVFVSFCKIPEASFQDIVMVCSPGSRFFGGSHFQVPSCEIVVDPVIGTVELIVIVILVPAGPSPISSGLVVFSVS